MPGLFITGTDTDCGKTFVSCRIIEMLRDQGMRVGGFKPVAAGAAFRDGKLRNDDVLALAAASRLDLPYALMNPYCLAPAIAPHLAAAEAGLKIELPPVLRAFEQIQACCDVVIVEGAGGWAVPLGDDFDIAGLAVAIGLPVILVIDLRLGCINHARLSEQAILASGATLAGWIGTQVDPQMPRMAENVSTLRSSLNAPCLGILPHTLGGVCPAVQPLLPGVLQAAAGWPGLGAGRDAEANIHTF